MKKIFQDASRGKRDFGRLKTAYSFSFGDWYNPSRVGFGKLVVLNDDIVAPGYGFPMHDHASMEIITIVTKGALEHKDSEGNTGIIYPGDVQIMSAGSGIHHSEYNPLSDSHTSLLQLWIEPRVRGGKSRYDQNSFAWDKNEDELTLVVSSDGSEKSLAIQQDAYISLFVGMKSITYEKYNEKNAVFLFVLSGGVQINELFVKEKDSCEIVDEDCINIQPDGHTTYMIVEVPF